MSSDGAKLWRAAKGGAKVKRLLVDVNGTVHPMSLIEATRHGRAADVAALLADGADVNEAKANGIASTANGTACSVIPTSARAAPPYSVARRTQATKRR